MKIKELKTLGLKTLLVFAATVIFSLFPSWAQDSTMIKGVVISQAGKPLAGVSISIEGSIMMPVITNEAGEFELKAPRGDEWLIFSPTGNFKSKSVYLNNRRSLKVYLPSKDLPAGDDRINILDQMIARRNIVSAYTSVASDNLHYNAYLSVDNHLQGRVPGMHVVSRSGMPGDGAYMSLRGISSINATTQPMFIVDGIPVLPHGVFGSNLGGYEYNPLLMVNPFDISTTTVIKDPSILSAYGSKASNGIILIETLDPSVTQTTIELDVRAGYSLAPERFIPQMNADQHKTLINEILFSSGKFEEEIKEEYPNLYLEEDDDRYIDYQHDTNWQEFIFRNSSFRNINLKVKGGDEIARYGLSFGYIDSDGIISETSYQGYNLRFVSRLNIFTWLKMNAGVALNYSTSQLKEAATVDETSPIITSLAKSPMLNPFQYDVEGRELTTLSEVDELGISNPLAVIDNFEARNTNYNFISTIGFQAILSKNISLNTNFSLNYNVLKEQLFLPNHGMELYYDQEAHNVAKSTNNSLNSFYNQTYLKYNKNIGNNHRIISTAGMNLQSNNFELDWGLTKNAHENDEYRTLQDGQNALREIGGANRIWNWISFFESLNYSYRDRYLLTATMSLDGSSRVGDNAINTFNLIGAPFGFFYAAGIGWRVSNERFLSNINWLEDLKLRASYGVSGNDDIGEASATRYYESVKFRQTVGLYPAVLPNDELSYETVTQLDAGIDISLFGDRITTNIDIFKSTTDNMLVFSPIDAYFGYEFRMENNGQMENRGYEIAASIRVVDFKDFKWDVQAYISSFTNEIIAIRGDRLLRTIKGAELVNEVGSPVNSYYGFVFKGVFSTQEEAANSMLLNAKGIPYQAGDAIYEDISGPEGMPDSIINQFDKTTIGSAMPDLFGGIINTFTYKRFSLSGMVQFVKGNDIFNYVRYKNESMSTLANQSSNVLNRWQFDGQETDVPRALYNDPVGNSAFSTRWIEDGSYLRIKNITFSYKIPEQFLTFRNAEFYISANNIITFSNYLGYDPEFAFSYSSLHQGVDYGLMPHPRQFLMGIKLGF